MEVVDVLLAVDSNLDLFMLGLGDGLVGDGREHTLMDGGVMMAVPLHELGHGVLGCVHGVLRLCGNHLYSWRVECWVYSEVLCAAASLIRCCGDGSDGIRQSTEMYVQGNAEGEGMMQRWECDVVRTQRSRWRDAWSDQSKKSGFLPNVLAPSLTIRAGGQAGTHGGA